MHGKDSGTRPSGLEQKPTGVLSFIMVATAGASEPRLMKSTALFSPPPRIYPHSALQMCSRISQHQMQ